MKLILFLIAYSIVTIKGEYEFTQETVKSVILDHLSGDMEVNKCKELCESAMRYTSIFYMDKMSITRGHTYEVVYPGGTKVEVAIDCRSLPVIYISRGSSSNQFKIISLQPSTDRYKFEKEIVESVTLASKKNYPEQLFENNPLATLGLEDRRHLCVAIRKQISIELIDNYVLKAHAYKIKENVAVAIPCPSKPKVYIRLGDTANEMKVVLPEDVTVRQFKKSNNFEESEFDIELIRSADDWIRDQDEKVIENSFLSTLDEQGREDLCRAARNHLRYEIEQFVTIRAPQIYIFQYPSGAIEKHVALVCNLLIPTSLYLRIGETSNDHIIIILGKEDLVKMEMRTAL